MAENCPISSLNISFCYKIPPQEVEVIVSMLRAKGTLQSFEAMGHLLSPIGLELLVSTHSLNKLSLCGVNLVTDDTVDLVAYTIRYYYTVWHNITLEGKCLFWDERIACVTLETRKRALKVQCVLPPKFPH